MPIAVGRIIPGIRRGIAGGGVSIRFAGGMAVLHDVLPPGFDIAMPAAARVVGQRFVVQYAG